MKIGIFDPYIDDIGGGEKYMMSIASCLLKKHRVDLFWDNPKDLKLVKERFGLHIDSLNLVPNLFTPKTSLLKRFIQTQSYDGIIVLSDGSIPLVGSKKLFVHIQQPLKYLQNTSILGKVKVLRVTKFFCNSLYTSSFLDKRFHVSSTIIYPPVALYPENHTKENVILHVGRFRVKNVSNGDYKKQSVMIDAFKDMVEKGLKGWKFILAVSFSEKEKDEFESMKKKAQGYPIEFYINQTNKQLWGVYTKAKIYWHASGYGEDLNLHPEFAEHFGISTVEAMGAGVVPVVINAGGQKEIVTEGENGFLWNTLSELESKTHQLINDPKLLEKLSKKAAIKAEEFGEKAFEEKIARLVGE